MKRRTLLSAAAPAALALSGAAIAAPPDLDAELLALCATYHRQDEISRDEGNPDSVWEAAADARHAAFMQIMPIVPITEAGHRAKAGGVANVVEMV